MTVAERKRFGWAVAFLGVLLCLVQFYVPDAWAATGCGGSDIFSNIYSGAGGGGGDLVAKATAPNAGSVVAIFSGVLGFFQSTVESVMSQMYCSFQSALVGPINLAVTLFVIVFGILIATGMSPFTVKEASVALFKIALIWAFATNADWGIGIGYRFFMGVAQEGSDIVLQAICGSGSTPTLTQPDSLITSFASLLDGTGATIQPPEGCLDNSITWPAVNPACGNYLMIALAIMVFGSPSAISFVGILVIEYLTLYVRALVGYLASLVFITFLFILSPLFISFALFRSTFHLFSKWLQFLTSFSLQMVLIFAFLAMITAVSGHMIAAFFQFLALFQPYDITMGSFETHMPMTVCSICEGSVTPGANGAMPTFQCGSGGSTNDGVQGSSGSKVIPLTNLYLHQDLVAFIVAQAVAWWLIAYVLGEFMQKAPELARKLAGAPMSGGLGGMPSLVSGVQASGIQYPGIDALSNAAKGAVKSAAENPWVRGGIAAAAAAAAGLGGRSGHTASGTGSTGGGNPKKTTPTGSPQMTDAARQFQAQPQNAGLAVDIKNRIQGLQNKLVGRAADSDQAKKIQDTIRQAQAGMNTADSETALNSILTSIAAAEKIV